MDVAVDIVGFRCQEVATVTNSNRPNLSKSPHLVVFNKFTQDQCVFECAPRVRVYVCVYACVFVRVGVCVSTSMRLPV